MKTMTYIINLAVFALFSQVFAQAPDWEDDPGAYFYTSFLVGGVVLYDGEQMGGDGDIFAAFDAAGNVRGVGVQLSPPFGPYLGTPVFEMTMRSNADGDVLSFKYYDTSNDAILDITETYTFSTGENVGSVISPIIFDASLPDLTCC